VREKTLTSPLFQRTRLTRSITFRRDRDSMTWCTQARQALFRAQSRLRARTTECRCRVNSWTPAPRCTATLRQLRQRSRVPFRTHRGIGHSLFGCFARSIAAVGKLSHVSGQRPVFGQPARDPRGGPCGPASGISARLQRLFPETWKCLAIQRDGPVFYEKRQDSPGQSEDIDLGNRFFSGFVGSSHPKPSRCIPLGGRGRY
jgi:hypothetical protein